LFQIFARAVANGVSDPTRKKVVARCAGVDRGTAGPTHRYRTP